MKGVCFTACGLFFPVGQKARQVPGDLEGMHGVSVPRTWEAPGTQAGKVAPAHRMTGQPQGTAQQT